MYKGLIAEIAKEVGNSAALILNQIYQWFKTNKVDKVYRTNEELKSDLCDLISTATIQRAKRKLMEKGYILVSFDKGLNRTTHFTLTEKAKKLLSSDNTVKPKAKVYKSAQPSQAPVATSKSMQVAFEEQGKPKEGVLKGIPESLKKLVGLKKKPVDSKTVEEKKEVVGAQPLPPLPLVEANEEFFGESVFLNTHIDEVDNDMSDEEYFGVTPEQWACIDIAANDTQDIIDEKLTMADLLNVAFNKIPNVDIREKNRELLNMAYEFKEDY